MASYIEQHYPDQFKALGNATNFKDIEKSYPELLNLALMLNVFLFASARIKIESQTQPEKIFTPDKIDKDNSEQKYLSKLPKDLVYSSLLGQNQCRICHKENKTVRWFIQKINYYIDQTTGEIHDTLALEYRDVVRAAGYYCELYYIASDVLGCLVLIGKKTIQEAKKIAYRLAKDHVQIRPDFNSLESYTPVLLSLNRNGEMCSFYDANGDDYSALSKLFSAQSQEVDETANPLSAKVVEDAKTWIKTDWVVEKNFRDLLVSNIGKNPIFLMLVGLALFSAFRDEDDDEFAVIDTATMCEILGKQSKHDIIGFNLGKLNKLVQLEVKNHSRIFHRATSFKIKEPEPFMIEMAEKINHPKQNPVMLSDGSKIVAQEIISEYPETAYPNEVSERLRNYLNQLPTNTFTKRLNSCLDAMIAATELLDDDSREKTLKSLAAIQINPKPLYQQTRKTVRLYAIGGHYQLLKREIRNIAFSDCLKLDLTYSQLAISSKLFGCVEMAKLCESGTIWNHLTNITNLEKRQIKKYIYSLLFQDLTTTDSNTKQGNKTVLEKLLTVPEFKCYFDRRRIYLESNLNHTYHDCFGNFLIGEKNQKLSALLQSYELKLLKPALDYFYNIKNNRTKIVLYLFDGLYLSGSVRECYNVSEKMIRLVNKNADSLEIPTRLSME